jgi:hypothetical protein
MNFGPADMGYTKRLVISMSAKENAVAHRRSPKLIHGVRIEGKILNSFHEEVLIQSGTMDEDFFIRAAEDRENDLVCQENSIAAW